MHKTRSLYLVAYDVCDPKRLYRVHRYLTAYKVEGQKSVFEIWVTPTELEKIRCDLAKLIHPAEDRVHFLALDPRMKPRLYGVAKHFDQKFFAVV